MICENKILREADSRLDELEAELINCELVDCPLIHIFTPNMYVRQIFMNKNVLLVSKIHNTEHPFCISKGRVSVKIDNGQWELIEAPYLGITKRGTRRILYIHEDCIWQTFHPLDFITGNENDLEENELNELIEEIENRILEPHTNSVIGEDINKVYKELLSNNKLL